MEVVECTEQQKDWEEYVNLHPLACHYHQWGWKSVIEEAFGHSTRYLTVKDGKTVLGILPLIFMSSRLFGRFLVSVPFVNYGGLLTTSREAAIALLSRAEAIAKETDAEHMELRHIQPVGLGLQPKHHKVTLVLKLAGDRETQWKNFDCKLRNQIRKAEKSGLSTESGKGECLEDFYHVFAETMRDLGTPVYGKLFFQSIMEKFPAASILLVKMGRKVVAAGFLLPFRETVEMPWAGSLRAFRPLCPNMLLYWEAMRQAIQQGFRMFDFGRSTPEEGTYRFKRQWGAVPVPLVWEYWMSDGQPLPDLSPKNSKYQVAISVWKKMPLALTNRLGPPIVRHIP